MAAVLCLMFLPLIGGVLFMIGSMGSISLGTVLAATTFVLLAGGLIVGTIKLSRTWEEEELE